MCRSGPSKQGPGRLQRPEQQLASGQRHGTARPSREPPPQALADGARSRLALAHTPSPTAQRTGARQPAQPRRRAPLTDGAHHRLALAHKLAADVDVARARAHAHACGRRMRRASRGQAVGPGSQRRHVGSTCSRRARACPHMRQPREGELDPSCAGSGPGIWRLGAACRTALPARLPARLHPGDPPKHRTHPAHPRRGSPPPAWAAGNPAHPSQHWLQRVPLEAPPTRDEAALHQLVRLVPHDLAVLARARLALVAVDHQVRGAAVAGLRGVAEQRGRVFRRRKRVGVPTAQAGRGARRWPAYRQAQQQRGGRWAHCQRLGGARQAEAGRPAPLTPCFGLPGPAAACRGGQPAPARLPSLAPGMKDH